MIRLGAVPEMVCWLTDKGELTGYRIGRIIRIKELDLLTYGAFCKIQPVELAHPVQYRRSFSGIQLGVRELPLRR